MLILNLKTMTSKNILTVGLTVVIASAIIVGGAYAVKNWQDRPGPGETVLKFYEDWVKYEGNPLADKIYRDHVAVSSEYAEKVDRILASFDKGGYDPILCAQDKPESIEIEDIAEKDGSASVVMMANFYGTEKKLDINMKFAEGKWQITNIICPDSGASDSGETVGWQNAVGDHIRGNISDLSPEKKVLGGSFYITNIEFLDASSALVEYEDGHKAYTAKADFTITPDEEVTINSFELLEGGDEDISAEVDFSETGNLTEKNGGWQLVYEKPGQPALTARLNFTDQSQCITATGDKIPCSETSWEQGARATVNGIEKDGAVEVVSIALEK